MKPEHVEQLRAGRQSVVEQRDALMALPEAERVGLRGSLRTWERSVRSTGALLSSIDSLIGMGKRRAKLQAVEPAAKKAAAPDSPEVDAGVCVASIPKGRTAELRVTVRDWKGRRIVDVRVWALPKGGGDHVPSRKGVAVDESKLDALIEALHAARQHV